MKYYKKIHFLLTKRIYCVEIYIPQYNYLYIHTEEAHHSLYDKQRPIGHVVASNVMELYKPPIIYDKNIKCVFTEKYRNIMDCNCGKKCSATQNDLQLLFKTEEMT